jgi:hypothetical protein
VRLPYYRIRGILRISFQKCIPADSTGCAAGITLADFPHPLHEACIHHFQALDKSLCPGRILAIQLMRGTKAETKKQAHDTCPSRSCADLWTIRSRRLCRFTIESGFKDLT